MSNPTPDYTPSHDGYQTQYGAGYTQAYPGAQQGSQQIPESSEHVTLIRQKESFVWQIILSCTVLWFCCCPIGIAAFVFAILAYNRSQLPDEQSAEEAHKLGVYSTRLSYVGVMVGAIFVIIAVGITIGKGSK